MTDRRDEDHPQTIQLEEDARGGGALFGDAAQTGEAQQRDESGQDDERPQDPRSADEAETVRAHAGGGHSIGEALGSGAGRDVGAGTPGDKGDLGGGGSTGAA